MNRNRTKITINTYNQHAHQYAARFMGMDLYHKAYNLFCKFISVKNADVFEIACGPGNVTQYLLTRRPDIKITGIDLAPNMVRLAALNNPSANFKIMDCRDLDKLEDEYDAVMCGFAMPYLTRKECRKLIGDVSKMLKPKGVFYFSTMEGAYSDSGFEHTSFSNTDQVYIHYHQFQYLMDCCNDAGFELLDFQRIDCPEPDGRILKDMIFIVEKC